MLRFLPRCLAMLVLAPLAANAAAEVRDGKGVAVIVGNKAYEHRDVPDVDFAHRDADAFRRYVLDVLGYDRENVIDLRDATRRQLFDAFGTRTNIRGLLWSYLDPDGGSNVAVFYSGHGVPGPQDGRGYLLPVDADPKAAEDDGYPIDLLYRNLGSLAEAETVRVYLDACFSGGSPAGALIKDASPVFLTPALPEGVGAKVVSLGAASGKQIASWDEKAGHGLFTNHLLDALYGRGDTDGDGRVTAAEAKAYLDSRMTRAARRQHRRIQRASLLGAGDAVMAMAPVGGEFPERPVIDDNAEGSREGSGTDRGKPLTSPDFASAEAGLGLQRSEKRRVQHGLASLGHDPGPADGMFGRGTRAALKAWQAAQGHEATGWLTADQARTLIAAGKEREPGSVFRDCPECPEMVVVPAGSFTMGSPLHEKGRFDDEGPRRRVTIGPPFAVGKYEVTFAEWDACVAAGGCGGHRPSDEGWGRGRQPAINVSWHQAKAYAEWLSRRTGKRYRLLSEAEWEYAARAGTTGPFYFGKTISTDRANYDGNYVYGSGPKGIYREKTVPVGSFPSNGFGLHDMHGNAREWVEDCWHGNYSGAPNSGGPWMSGGDCKRRVLRGGSFYSEPRFLRSAIRNRDLTGDRDSRSGFRVARTLSF